MLRRSNPSSSNPSASRCPSLCCFVRLTSKLAARRPYPHEQTIPTLIASDGRRLPSDCACGQIPTLPMRSRTRLVLSSLPTRLSFFLGIRPMVSANFSRRIARLSATTLRSTTMDGATHSTLMSRCARARFFPGARYIFPEASDGSTGGPLMAL